MIAHKATFNLKGTNILFPQRYKIRKQRPLKSSTSNNQEEEKMEKELVSPFVVESKDISLYPKYFTPLKECPSQKQLQSQLEKSTKGMAKGSLRKREHHSSSKVKRCACGNCEECLKDFAYYLNLFSDNRNAPQITAKSWCIWKKKNNRFTYFYGKRVHKVREIASLSKMVTAMATIDFLNKHGYQIEKISYQIRKTSTMIGGTTAGLVEGESYCLQDLLYGMMLPSGNDAAIALSEAIGLLWFIKSKGRQVDPYEQDWQRPYKKNYSFLFISLMNEKCERLGAIDTHMYNSHGNDAFDQLKNVSTCNQIGKIASEFLSYPLLREVARTPSFKNYENTNKLLEDGFEGIKTGITDTAGPCLAAAYKDFVIVVLNSKSMNERWMEVKKLVKWMLSKN